jgi:hypothetical protein
MIPKDESPDKPVTFWEKMLYETTQSGVDWGQPVFGPNFGPIFPPMDHRGGES